jgi:3-dehydroquinate dehydratase-2
MKSSIDTQGGDRRRYCDQLRSFLPILDALNAFDGPVFEIHISNVHKREAFRHHSYVSSRADGVIAGCGTQGYTLALQRLARLIDETAAKSG